MERIHSPENHKHPVEKSLDQLNQVYGYTYAELADHNPSENIWAVQLQEEIVSNVKGNLMALDQRRTEEYAQHLREKLQNTRVGTYYVVVKGQPSVHLVVEKID